MIETYRRPSKKFKVGMNVGALVAAGAFGVGTYSLAEMARNNSPSRSKSPTHFVSHERQLETLPSKYPNVISVTPDLQHPGLDKVTYRFTPGHDTLSDVYMSVAPEQDNSDAAKRVESYNGGNEIVRNGEELNIDVDIHTGFIVPNPDKGSSGASNT